MEDEDQGDDQPPYMTGKHVHFTAEEVIKVLKTVTDKQCINIMPSNVKGGEVYIFKPASETKSFDWKKDGLKWKNVASVHVPKGKTDTVTKRTFTLINRAGSRSEVTRKDVFSPDFGESSDMKFLVHYFGSGETVATDDKTICQEGLVERPDDPTDEQEDRLEQMDKSSEGRHTRIEPDTEVRESSEPEGTSRELEAALQNVKDNNSKPVEDVLNETMETVATDNESPKSELSLDVSNTRSGEPSMDVSESTQKSVIQSPGQGIDRGHLKREKRKRTYSEEIGVTEKSKCPKKEKSVIEMTLYNGKKKTFPVPRRESIFSFTIISEEEKEMHADFFNSTKKGKNSSRYLKIRNHIITLWNKNKPNFVNKLKARHGLTDCGDVAAIGRIHSYLECKGVINFNAVQNTPSESQTIKKQRVDNGDTSDGEDAIPSPPRSTKRKDIDTETPIKGKKRGNANVSDKIGGTPIPEKKNKKTEGKAITKIASKASNNKEFDSPATRRTSLGRTRNIKSPNWADIMSGKVAFREDHVKSGNSSPAKLNKSANKPVVKSPENRGRPRLQKTNKGENETHQKKIRNKTDSDQKQTNEEDDKMEHKQDEIENTNKTAKTSLDEMDHDSENKDEGGTETEDTNVVDSETLQDVSNEGQDIDTETTKRQKGRPRKNVHGTEGDKDVEKNISGGGRPRKIRSESETREQSDTEDEDIHTSGSKTKSPNQNENLDDTSIESQTPKRSKGRPRKVIEDPDNVNNSKTELSKSDSAKSENEVSKLGNEDTFEERSSPDNETKSRKEISEQNNENESEKATPKRGRGRPHKVRSESEESMVKEKKCEPKRGRGRPRKYAENLYRKNESQEIKSDIVGWSGSGNLCKVRVKGNRHMPFQIKEVDKHETEENGKENVENVRSSSRIRKNRFECEVCKKTFSVEYIYEDHKKSHAAEGYIESTPDIDELDDSDNDRDFTVEENEEEGEDNLDDEKQDQEKQLKKLDLVKIEPANSTKKLSSKHREGDKPVCTICDVSFLSFANLRKHSLLHSNCMYECPYCAKLMKRKDYVNAHIRKVHKEIDVEQNPVDFTKYTHMIPGVAKGKIGTAIKEENDTLGKDDGNSEKKLNKSKTGLGKSVCPECSKVYDDHSDLEQHMILVHNKELKDAAYTCHACSKQFKSLVSFQVHKLTHRKKNHDCQHCGKVFKTNSQLQVHRRHDHNVQYGTLMYFGFLMNEGQIACEVCSARFENMGDYYDHRLDHLTFEFLCKECGNGFESEEEFKKHEESKCSFQNLHLPCGKCDQRFSMYDTRRKHLVANHPKDAQNYCHHCAATFDNLPDLTEHFASHLKEKIFVCEYCEKKFFEKRNLIDHRVLHRSSKNYKCSLCDNYYISSKSLQRHIKLHLTDSKFKCSQCESKFNKKDDLDRHFMLHHAGDDTSENSNNTCNICGRKFFKRGRLVKHMQVHIKGENDAKYTCSHCGVEFNPKEMPLWKHMKESHPEEVKQKVEKKELICETCGFTTVHPQRLARHLETHNPDKKFSCMYCDKLFQTTSSLLTHMMIHRGRVKSSKIPPTDCSWPGCQKKFFKRSGMKSHLLTHIFKLKNGKDTCECVNCTKSELDPEFAYFQEGDNAGILMDGNTVLLRQDVNDASVNQNSETINVVISSGGIIQSYESMNVLQEAIAKIEDLEKGVHQDGGETNELIKMTDVIDTLNSGEEMIEGHEARQEQDVNQVHDVHQVMNTDEVESGISNDIGVKVQPDMVNSIAMLTEDSVVDTLEASYTNNNNQALCENDANSNEAMVENISTVTSAEIEAEVTQTDTDMAEEENKSFVVSNNNPPLPDDNAIVSDMNKFDDASKVLGLPMENGADTANAIGLQMKNEEFTQNTEQEHTETVKELEPEPEGYECTYCELLFQTKCMVLSHLEEDHIDHQFPSCEVCGKHFIDSKGVRDHSVIHSTERSFACDRCGKAFRTKQCLRQHSFIHSEVKPFICSYCGHGFTQKGFFEEHMRRHTGQKPFKCKICFKGFYSKNLRKLHMYSHTGDNPHKCEHCTKSFREKYILAAHMRTHREERPFKCNHCEKAFFVRPKLIRHLNTVHGIRKEFLTEYFATRIGTGFGYRNKRTTLKSKSDLEEPRKTQIVYIDHQGNIVSQEMRTETEIKKEKEKKRKDPIIKRVAPKPSTDMAQTHVVVGNTAADRQVIARDAFEVLTRKDSSGQILVNPIISEDMSQVISETGVMDMGQNIVYQDIQTINPENSIELDGENYTFVTQGDDQGHIQLIKHALAGVQDQIKHESASEIEIITEEVDTGEIPADSENDIAVYSGESGEGLEHVAENFSINIGEDGTVDAADFEKIEALRTLYNDQPIVIVLESQHAE